MTHSKQALKERFSAEGVSVVEWAKRNGFKVRTVRAVIAGDLKCSRGESHRIAVALGLKPPPARCRLVGADG